MGTAVKNITRNNIITGVACTLLSLFFRSGPKTAGVFLGCAIMTLNFMAYVQMFKRLMESGKVDKRLVLTYIIKIAVLFVLVFLVLSWAWINKIFFIAGILVIIASFIFSTVFQRGGEAQ